MFKLKDEGRSIKEIVASLNEYEKTRGQDTDWTRDKVAYRLTNETYKGETDLK